MVLKKKRKPTHSEHRLSQFKKKHARLHSTLLNLKLQYEHGNISYETYSKFYDYYLHSSKPNELNHHYTSNIKHLKAKIAKEKQKREVAHENRLIRATRVTFAVFVFFLAGYVVMLLT